MQILKPETTDNPSTVNNLWSDAHDWDDSSSQIADIGETDQGLLSLLFYLNLLGALLNRRTIIVAFILVTQLLDCIRFTQKVTGYF